jgi:hypothetical protein
MSRVTVDVNHILGDRPQYDTKREYTKYVTGYRATVERTFGRIGWGKYELEVEVDIDSLPLGVTKEMVAETVGVGLTELMGDFDKWVECK